MKLELEQEFKQIENLTWYRVTVDGKYITGSYNKEEIEKVFEKIKANPEILKNETFVLLSTEI